MGTVYYKHVGHPKSERGSGPRNYERTYRWDRGNQLREIAEAVGVPGATTTPERRFSHDARGRLTGASYSDGRAEELRLPDAVGNLFRTAGQGDREYGASGQLLRGSDGTRYGYDAEGNLVTKVTPAGERWRYRWTGGGMLREVVRPDGARVRMTYDGLGRRVAKAFVPGGVTSGAGYVDRWVWDGNVMLHEWRERRVSSRAAAGRPQPPAPSKPTPPAPERRRLRFERSGGGLVSAPAGGDAPAREQQVMPVTAAGAQQTDESDATAAAEPEVDAVITEVASINAELTTWVMEPETFRPLARLSRHSAHAIVTDHLGTPIRMYDRLGRESGTLDFTVYGKEHGAGFRGWMGCPFRYPGQYADAETGLYYNRFRYYDPEAGQYISQDPIGLAGGNPTLYGYVGDVGNQYDPFGLIILYRALHPSQEAPAQAGEAILPKDSAANYSVQQHVENGKLNTQYISTSKKARRAKFYARSRRATVIAIDTDRLDPANIMDISNGLDPQTGKPLKGRALGFAVLDAEVLVKGGIPEGAYSIHTPCRS